MQDLEPIIQEKGQEILRKMEGFSKTSLFSKNFWYGSIMDWSLKNEEFKTNLFRFVDVLPTLKTGGDIAQHLREYFEEKGELPSVFKVGLGLGAIAPGIMANTIKQNVSEMAKMFITGSDPKEALAVLKKARKNKITFTVDLLGEATLSEKEALDYQNRYFELIDWLAKDAETWEEIAQIDRDDRGPIPKVNVSVKLTALSSQISEKAWDKTKDNLKERLRPLLRRAQEKNIFLNFDMEHFAVKNLTVEVFSEIISETEFKAYPFFGCVIQAYLKDSLQDLKKLSEISIQRGMPFTVRLVKGAYWDSETIESKAKDWPVPVFENKAATDANYEKCARFLFDNAKYFRIALASHNVRSLAAAIVYSEKLGLPKNSFEVQMLFGMADPIKKAMVDLGFRVREYAPIGEMLPGMAYLVRRLLENTSNESWLRGKFADGKNNEKLLQNPEINLPKQNISATDPQPTYEFNNFPLADFTLEANRKAMLAALDKTRKSLPFKIKPSMKATSDRKTFERANPSNISEKIAVVEMANLEDAAFAVAETSKAYPAWKKKTFSERAVYLEKLADLFERDRWQLSAQQTLEVGKPWAEADADVAETIDFCRYYAKEARKLDTKLKVGHAPGEHSFYSYKSRGVTAVISPWNFPLAILTGQTVASLVTGNPVVMKPAEQSMMIAYGLYQRLIEAGVPENVVQFLPGFGEEVGAAIVRDAKVVNIAFTGSKAVGLEILREASVRRDKQIELKRCIIEMGGKNALIIDSDADLDEAVDAVLYSAFGFSGQKCSAASRCIVLTDVYEKFSERLVEAAKSYVIGNAENPASDLGPVVDEDSQQRLLGAIAQARSVHSILYQSPQPENGYYVPLTIFGKVDSGSQLAQTELFGPVLCLIQAKDFDDALKIANSTEYALTGGIFSRSPRNIERAKNEFEVGNLYINRSITGAMVERHPFGGYKMSGIGSKTGGPDYLKQFMEPVCVTENMMRRGFAPDEKN